MNKQELKDYIIDNHCINCFTLQIINNILDYAEGMEENEQYGFLGAMLPIPESVIKKVYY